MWYLVFTFDLIVAALYCVFGIYQPSVLAKYILKPLIPLSLFVFSLTFHNHKIDRRFLLCTYLLCTIGDILMIPSSKIYFDLGMLCYALNYAVLSLNGFHLVRTYNLDIRCLSLALVLYISVMAVVMPPLVMHLISQLSFLIAIISYALVMMIAGVITTYTCSIIGQESLPLFFGTLCLIIGDVLLIYQMTFFDNRPLEGVSLWFYWVGLIILSRILLSSNETECECFGRLVGE